MKTKTFASIVCPLIGVMQLHAQGYLIENGIKDIGYTLGGYEFQVTQNPTNGDYTGFLLTPIPPADTNTFAFDSFADEGVRAFLVLSNAPISLQPIMAGNYTELLNSDIHVFDYEVPFYLGFYTGYMPQGGIYENPVFGWGLFVNNEGVIQLLSSAIEIEGGGIYAGTQNIIPIPEPNVFRLGALGAVGLVLARLSGRFTPESCVAKGANS